MLISVTILANTDYAEAVEIEFTIEDGEVCWSVVDQSAYDARLKERYIHEVGETGVVERACLEALKEID